MTPRANPKVEEAKVVQFNAAYPVGTLVDVLMDDGTVVRGKTRWPASIMAETIAVGWVSGIRGAYKLDRITAVKEVA